MKIDWSRERAFRVDADGCLLWRGPVHSKGYPTIPVGDGTVLLRRAILSLIKGRPLRQSERAIATCGKDRCCSCLQAVSHSKVQQLAIERNDWTKQHARRLKIAAKRTRRWSDADVADMRARKASGERVQDIARAHGTKSGNICAILNYKSHVLRLPDAVRHALTQAV